MPVGHSIWVLDIRVSLSTNEGGKTLFISTPYNTPTARVIRQQLTHPDWRVKRSSAKDKESNQLVARTSETGKAVFLAEFLIQQSPVAVWPNRSPHRVLNSEQRQTYLSISETMLVNSQLVFGILERINAALGEKTMLPDDIFQFVHKKITTVSDPKGESVDFVLSELKATTLGRSRAFVVLCREIKVPARLVTGVTLQESLDSPLHYWVEVYNDDTWVPYDPEYGYMGTLPPNYLPLLYDGDQIVYTKETIETEIDIEVSPELFPVGILNAGKKRLTDLLDLTRLPGGLQLTLVMLLMLPFGALITAFFRLMVGVRTYGTFTATLLAMSLLFADWITVSVIVLLVLTIGVGGRALLPEKITRVPRLSMVFTMVVFCLVLAVSLLDYFDLVSTTAIVLLPIVVLTGLVDSVYRIADENGFKIALVRLAWTGVVAFFCFWVLRWTWLSQKILEYPEFHFVTLALFLLFTLYKATKLMELPFFKVLAEPKADSKT